MNPYTETKDISNVLVILVNKHSLLVNLSLGQPVVFYFNCRLHLETGEDAVSLWMGEYHPVGYVMLATQKYAISTWTEMLSICFVLCDLDIACQPLSVEYHIVDIFE